jgi:serine/threonine-protein kinase
MNPPSSNEPRYIGRYALYDEIAAGGMATVHLGRLIGPVGFSRTVAIKRLHPQFAKDPEFVAMFLDEARLAARIRHPNVVPTLDVVALDHELFLVMEYVQGESLSRIVRASMKQDPSTPLPLVTTIMAGVLHGLHAAHEAKTEQGEALSIVHRDVSPQNVLVGIDGVPRVLDFGVAKAAHRAHATREGQVKGKIAYMAPEQLRSDHVDRRCDVYAASVVLWEAVTRKRLYQADTDARVMAMVLFEDPPAPSTLVPGINPELERIILRGLARDRDQRYATAREMALDLENCLPLASASAIGGWVERLAGDTLGARARRVATIESSTSLPQIQLPAMPSAPVPASAPIAASAQGAPSAPIEVDEPTLTISSVNDAAEQAAVLSRVTAAAASPAPSRSRGLFIGLAAGGAILVAVAFLAISSAKHAPEADAEVHPQHPAATAEVPAAATASPVVNSVTSATPSSTVSAVTPAPTARASATPSAKPSTPAVVRATPVAPAQPAKNCKPPYTTDGSGIRHMKPECL